MDLFIGVVETCLYLFILFYFIFIFLIVSLTLSHSKGKDRCYSPLISVCPILFLPLFYFKYRTKEETYSSIWIHLVFFIFKIKILYIKINILYKNYIYFIFLKITFKNFKI